MQNDASYSWRGGFCLEVKPLPTTLVIFGAEGDLAGRKLFPSLYSLQKKRLLHENSKILACARSRDMNDAAYRNSLREILKKAEPAECDGEDCLNAFLEKVYYHGGDYSDPDTYRRMTERLAEIEHSSDCGRVFYLSTAASMYVSVVEFLYDAGLTRESCPEGSCNWRHVVLEKPFGYDLESARALDIALRRTLQERQIYRIDHYLGKETVQNILMFRFANIIFEQVWNRNFIDSIQITAAETVGVEHRANYFERAGLLRDMFQNHMLEMLSLVAMEMPASFDADAVRDEKLKLLRSIRPFDAKHLENWIIRGQYTNGKYGETEVPAYRSEPKVASDSMTETYVAAKVMIDNWRWKDVPFYLRSGKRLPVKHSEIVVNFKSIPHSIFSPVKAADITPNQLIFSVQPEEGLSLTIQAKQPGPKLCMGALKMDFKYSSILEPGEPMPEAYERLLLDCMLGDQTLFIRSDTIELAWRLLTPVLNAWKENIPHCGELQFYSAGSWGPGAAEELLYRDSERLWHNP